MPGLIVRLPLALSANIIEKAFCLIKSQFFGWREAARQRDWWKLANMPIQRPTLSSGQEGGRRSAGKRCGGANSAIPLSVAKWRVVRFNDLNIFERVS